MEDINIIKDIQEKLQTAMGLPKCRKCGCMEETLRTLKTQLSQIKGDSLVELLSTVENSLEKMNPTEYT